MFPKNRPRLYIVAFHRPSGWQPDWKRFWPTPLPAPSLQSVLDTGGCNISARPTGRTAHNRVDQLVEGLQKAGHNPATFTNMVVNCRSINLGITQNYTPCLTSSRGAEGGFWLLVQGRMLSVTEMQRLQGVSPEQLNLSGLSTRQAGHMLGAAFTQSVVCRLLARMIQVGMDLDSLVDPYASLSEGGS